MINRILIRIKVVQILYSFLLMEKHFSLEGVPEPPTKEKRFAYSLYLDLLALLIYVSESITQRGGYQPLADTKFIKRLRTEDAIKSLIGKYKLQDFPFASVIDSIATRLKESGLYKNFLKDTRDGKSQPDASLWSDIYSILVYPDSQLARLITQLPGYTIKGAERAREMMNATFTNFMSSQDDFAEADRLLMESLDKARELYFRLLWLPVELTDMEERRLDARRYKNIVSAEDLNPNLKFVDNLLVQKLSRCEALAKYIEVNKISWENENRVMMDNVLKFILDSEEYKHYMSSSANDIKEDAEFWREMLKKVVYNNEYFLEALEDQSVFWNDDLEIIGTFALKTIRKCEESENTVNILDQFKDEEDARFGGELMRAVLVNRENYRSLIDSTIDKSQWESERLAFMDVVVMETALAEILNFPKIPLSASLNEYIEIAKSYSTSKSGGFVNGILGKIIKNLQEDGKLNKK